MKLRHLAAAVQKGEIQPVELVMRAKERIERFDGPINAVTDTCWDQALHQAANHNRQGPLAGLPVLVKDLVATKGMANRMGGFPLLADAAPDSEDDPTVAALVRAGAIVIGRSNSPSLGATGITDNALFGATRNPWNLERSPTGSSGGAGAALAAGLTAIATSSDAGGSTRSPAAACGLVGLKATAGMFIQTSNNRSLGTSGVGAMGLCVDDCLLEAEALIGTSPGNLFAPPAGAVNLAPRMPKRALAQATLHGNDVPPHLRAIFDAACKVIDDTIGIPVAPRPELDYSAFTDRFGRTFSVELKRALEPVREHWGELGGYVRHVLEFLPDASAMEIVDAYLSRPVLAAEIDHLLGDGDTVLLTLVNNWDVPDPHGATPDMPADMDPGAWSVECELRGISNTAFFNFSGHPAMSVPIGVGPDGVPVGLQIVGPRWGDGLLFGLAFALEQALPWPKSAPGYDPFA